MAAEHVQSDQFRGARIHLCDLAGVEIRDCEVSGVKIVDCYGSDIYLGGAFERLVVNDVDVTDYVESELDRQQPTRVLARDAESPDDYRAAWDAVEASIWPRITHRLRAEDQPEQSPATARAAQISRIRPLVPDARRGSRSRRFRSSRGRQPSELADLKLAFPDSLSNLLRAVQAATG